MNQFLKILERWGKSYIRAIIINLIDILLSDKNNQNYYKNNYTLGWHSRSLLLFSGL